MMKKQYLKISQEAAEELTDLKIALKLLYSEEREDEIRFLESLPLAGQVHPNAQETVSELTP